MVGLLTLAALQACTPALNWRQVQLQDLKARLPCKADTATRPVPLAATPLDLQMMGCEADGALFAISHVRAQDTEAATQVVQQWRAFALQALRTEALNPHRGKHQRGPRKAYRCVQMAKIRKDSPRKPA